MHKEAFQDMETIAGLEANAPGEYVQRARVKYLMKDTVGSIKDLDEGIKIGAWIYGCIFFKR
jgi:hypothetical protein